jgi:YD repeat-containing protein
MAIACVALPSVAIAQGTTQYVYDDNGRLHAVISPAGEATVWEYDAAGNFTAIRRLTANDLELLSFSPHEGVPGDLVTFTGVGFGAGVSAVSFNGTLSNNVQVTAPFVVAEVPVGATTGPITLTTPRGPVTTSIPFVIRGVRVNPNSATVVSRSTVQFTATVVLTGDQSVTWSVNGITGGNTALGTISDTGLYAAPDLSFNQRSALFSIRATSVATPTVFGEARVTVNSLQFVGYMASATFSVLNNISPVPNQPIPMETDSLSFSVHNTSTGAPIESPHLANQYEAAMRLEGSTKKRLPSKRGRFRQHHQTKGKQHVRKKQ